MAASNLDYNRFITLNQKVKNNTATGSEKDEYMLILYNNGNITKEQYDKYLADKSDEVVKAGLAIGGILLVAYLISELFKTDKK